MSNNLVVKVAIGALSFAALGELLSTQLLEPCSGSIKNSKAELSL